MPNENHEFLSFGDALFLYLEREGTPLNIASVGVFDGVIELEDFYGYIESKLPGIPRYLQRVVIPPMNIGAPSWEFDPFFDIHNHVRELALKRGTEEELKELAGRVLSTTMDRSRPLWDLTLVKGLRGKKTGLIARAHHCLADGLSGVGLLNALMDTTPEVPKIRRKPLNVNVPPPRDPFTLFADALIGSCSAMVQRTLMAYADILRMAQRLVQNAEKQLDPTQAQQPGEANEASAGLDSFAKMIPEMAQPIERLPFNKLCTGPQKFRWAKIPLPAIKAIKNAQGTTVNDVILTLVTAAFREYVALHGTNVEGRNLRIIVPVSVRDTEKATTMGNEITFVPVAAPLYLREPAELLSALHERMEALKTTRIPELAVFSGTLLGLIPSPLQAVFAPILSRLPISICNVICTNVPGPKDALYLLGHEMLSAYPYVPIGSEMGINCAVLTYNDTAFFGFTGDAYAAPDVERLEDFLLQSFAELQAVTGTSSHKKTPRVRRGSAKKREPVKETSVSAPAKANAQKRPPKKPKQVAKQAKEEPAARIATELPEPELVPAMA
jgi:WS/DGAT/MGAT family acyltransferase